MKLSFFLVSAALLIACGGSGNPQQAAGSTSGTGGGTTTMTGAGGGGVGGCTPQLHAKVLPGKNFSVVEGANSVQGTITTEFTVTCGLVSVSGFVYQFLTPDASLDDPSPFCAGICTGSNGNFYGLRLVDGQGQHFTKLTGLGLMEKDPETAPAVAVFDLNQPFVIAEGGPRKVSVEFDVASPLPSPAAHGKRFFVVPLGVTTDPPNALVEYAPQESPPYMTVE